MSELKKERKKVYVNLLVFASVTQGVEILNIENFEGLDEEIRAFGFNGDGSPVQSQKLAETCRYRICGVSRMMVNLMPELHKRRLGEILSGSYPISNEEASKELQLLGNAEKIYCFLESNVFAMPIGGYQSFEEGWIISAARPEKLYYSEWNRLLETIGSPWRIKTDEVKSLLRKQALLGLLKKK